MSESVQLKKASKNKKVEQKAAPESKSKQVLSLTQFCLFLFMCLEGKSVTSRRGNSILVPPSNYLVSVSDPFSDPPFL